MYYWNSKLKKAITKRCIQWGRRGESRKIVHVWSTKWRLEIWMSRCRWAEFRSYGRPRSWLPLCWEDTLLTNVNIEQELSWHLEGRCDCLHRCYKMIDVDKKRKVKRWEITESSSTVAKKSLCVKFHSFLDSFVVKSRLIIICQLLTNICLK